MKTFNKEDLITWANREKAVIGHKYYFGDSIEDIRNIINDECKKLHEETLHAIDDTNFVGTFIYFDNEDEDSWEYACILPVDKVIDEPKKKYRPCKSLREFYRVVMNEVPTLNMVEDDIIYDLMDSIIHIRNTKSSIEFHLNINGISTDLDGTRNVLIGNTYLSFKDLFDNSEIEINGKWLPFGVIDA